ncbi:MULTISPECIES: ABC transporter substrate-binding protein [unclassified Cetobacterium]|uniref:ABC transporter substrate-binding protein n=1 Tax=unclassified Cetobacterium TaxID=2630983 RepID=UPI00163BD5E3|nr:ABC transporter substrate-binding protein [Cetobacterium sp. 8H]MBC2850103.1 ABC transporter substrate-binding protein [Cetobacterium sp. 8H]
MKKTSKLLLLSSLFLGLATGAFAQKKFVLITMDSMDEHWLSVKKGAETKAKELGDVEILFRAPAGKVDPNEQTRMVEDAINQKVDAILLAPSDKSALAPVVERAIDEKIPVVIIDSPIDTEGYVTFLSTDNYAAGALAADTLAKLVDEKGKIGIINAQPGAGTAIARSSGFEDRVKEKYPNMKVVAVQYSNGDKAVALNQATDIMTANPDLAGFYGSNEGSTVGISRALEEAGKGGTVKLVGFDFSKDTITGLKNGTIQASMVQNPEMMGYEGVGSAYDSIQGKKVSKHIDTGVKVVTAGDLK